MRLLLPALLCTLAFSACQTPPQPAAIPQTPTAEFPAMTAFKKKVEDRLGPLWYRRINANREDVQIGTVKMTLEIPREGGSIRNLQVVANTGGPRDESIAKHAVEDLRVPPIPKAVFEKLPEGEPLVLEESFTVFGNR